MKYADLYTNYKKNLGIRVIYLCVYFVVSVSKVDTSRERFLRFIEIFLWVYTDSYTLYLTI